MADEKVLSFQNTVLRRSDLDILNGFCYLNDDIIGFYFQYLSSLFVPGDKILLVQPSIAYLLATMEDLNDIKENIGPLELSDKNIIIFPINNKNAFEMGDTGTHWSVLVYYRDMNSFVHHDSLRGVNNECATRLYEAVKGYVSAASSSKPSSKEKRNNKKKRAPEPLSKSKCLPTFPRFDEYDMSPQQINGYDCGLYVMAIAKTICDWHATKSRGKDADWFSAVEENVNELSVENAMRSEVVKLVEDLRLENC